MRSLVFLAAAALTLVSLGSTANATGSTAVPVPEPGSMSIIAAAMAGLVVAGRFIRRK